MPRKDHRGRDFVPLSLAGQAPPLTPTSLQALRWEDSAREGHGSVAFSVGCSQDRPSQQDTLRMPPPWGCRTGQRVGEAGAGPRLPQTPSFSLDLLLEAAPDHGDPGHASFTEKAGDLPEVP